MAARVHEEIARRSASDRDRRKVPRRRRRPGDAVGRQLPLEARAVGYALFVAVMLAFSVDALDPFIYFRF